MSPLNWGARQCSRSWYGTQTLPYLYKRGDISVHPTRYMTQPDSDHYLTTATLVRHIRHCRKTTTAQSRRAGDADTFQGTAIFPELRAGTLTNAGAHYSSNRWPEHIHLQGVAASPLLNFRHPTHYYMKGCTLFHERKKKQLTCTWQARSIITDSLEQALSMLKISTFLSMRSPLETQ